MRTVLVTGSRGFIGKNLLEGLQRSKNISIRTYDRGEPIERLETALKEADVVYHLAGVNRPKNDLEFAEVNTGLTGTLVSMLERLGKFPLIVLASSTQAELDNSYGKSKKAAEDLLYDHCQRNNAGAVLYRLPGVFGKWSRPNYNTVVATFCHNVSHNIEITISDREKEITLVYIDDVVADLLSCLERRSERTCRIREIAKTYRVNLGSLADRIHAIKKVRDSLVLPDLSDELTNRLYATYLSFLDKDDFAYPLDVKMDQRGCLFELIKSKQFGQIFLSRTHAGILRGNHYHNSKIEKFCVIQGRAMIRFRNILSDEVITYTVSGDKIEVVDIPPGYTHSIENVSDSEMIVLFWANQIFDPHNPDTYMAEV